MTHCEILISGGGVAGLSAAARPFETLDATTAARRLTATSGALAAALRP